MRLTTALLEQARLQCSRSYSRTSLLYRVERRPAEQDFRRRLDAEDLLASRTGEMCKQQISH